MTGILLIAIDAFGGGFYQQLAYNLALSIKLDTPNMPITVITDSVDFKYLSKEQIALFDYKIEAKEDDYFEEYLMNPFKLKTKIYEYTPFENTLYLDVDGLFLYGNKTLSSLFEKLNTCDFQIHEVRRYTKANYHESGMIWTQPNENSPNHFKTLWDAYGIGDTDIYPEYNSSFIWFKKTDSNKEYFNQVAINYNDRRVTFKALGKSYPDEMAWNITSAKMQHLGAFSEFKPCYFEWEHTNKEFDYIAKECWFMMLAGGFQITKMVTYYNNLIKSFRSQVNDTIPFNFEMSKKIFFRK